MKEKLLAILKKLSRARVLVLGDLMWDEYIYGDATRISPEAPVPVFLANEHQRTPGGAANVLKNLRDLGTTLGVLGVVGDDENGRLLASELQSWTSHERISLLALKDRPTTMKTRLMARNQQLLRIDHEKVGAIESETEEQVLAMLKKMLPSFQAFILSDYNKGLLTPHVIRESIRMAHEVGVFVAVDPQVKHFKEYVSCDIMTPNEKEASEGVSMPFPENDAETFTIATKIREELSLPHLLITRSQRGMAYFTDGKTVYLPTVAREVFDVTGAGDTVISVYTAALAAGAEHTEAMVLSNLAGGIVVGKLGTATAKIEELERELQRPLPQLQTLET